MDRALRSRYVQHAALPSYSGVTILARRSNYQSSGEEYVMPVLAN